MKLRLDTRADVHRRGRPAGRLCVPGTAPSRRLDVRRAHRRHRRPAGAPPHRRTRRRSAPTTASTCCTRWATRSRSPRPSTAQPKTALIVGAGYVGLEMAEGLTTRGIDVTQVEMLPEVLPTVDPELGALVHDRARHATASTSTPAPPSPASPRQRTRDDATGIAVRRTERPGRRAARLGRRPGPRRRRGPPRHRPARRPAPRPGPAAPSWSTRPWPPACRMCGRPATASSPTTACSASPTCRSARPRTSKAASPARTPSAVAPASPAASAPRSSRSSTSSPPAPGCASTKRVAAGYAPVTSQSTPRRPQGVLPGRPADHHPRHRRRRHRPAPRRPAGRRPRHRDRQARRHLRHRAVPRHDRRRPLPSSTSPTPRRSAHPGTPCRWPPRPGCASTSSSDEQAQLGH